LTMYQHDKNSWEVSVWEMSVDMARNIRSI
jgi:hypothetical protein